VTLSRDLARRQQNVFRYRVDLLRELGLRHSVRRTLANRRHRNALVRRRTRVPVEMWREAAGELGAEVRELTPTLLEFRLGDRVARVRGQTTPFTDPVSDEVASDKALSYQLLSEAGLPVPARALVRVDELDMAVAFLDRIGPPCVVKPARGGGGAGVTGEVRDAEQIRRALISAGRYDGHALLEQQVPGDSYRLLVLNGVVLDIIKRPLPRLHGDGRSTIEQLMFRQYAERIAHEGASGLKPFFVDLDCLFTLQHAGYGIRSVLPAESSVTVKTATNYNGPEEIETLPAPYPEKLVELARTAADAVGVRLAGVDLVAQTLDAAFVLEVNPIPGLTHHYNVADPTRAVRIAVPILAALLGAGPQDDAVRVT
jgi:cyanophycin synthetase